MTDLVLTDVTVCYGVDPAVHHLDLRLPFGTLVGILGPNGAGKSTLLRAILGWLPLTTGAILVDGQPVDRQRIAFLGQGRSQHTAIPLVVREVVEMGRYGQVGPWRGFTAEDHRIVDAAIAEMGLERYQQQSFAELSGGQVQRVLLARALATGADIFLLDEPFAGLDSSAVETCLRALRAWATRGRLVIVVAHEVDLVRRCFDGVVVLRHHLLAAGPPAQVLTSAIMQAAFAPVPSGHGMPVVTASDAVSTEDRR